MDLQKMPSLAAPAAKGSPWTVHRAIVFPLFTQLQPVTYTTALHVLSPPFVTPLSHFN